MKIKILLYSEDTAVTDIVTENAVRSFSDTADLDVCSSWSCFSKAKDYDLVLVSIDDTERIRNIIRSEAGTDFCYISDDLDRIRSLEHCQNCYFSGCSGTSFYIFLSNYLKTESIIGSLNDSNIHYSRELSELKVIDRAKLLLIQYFGFSEKQAHRFIEKQSMNLHLSRKMIAEQILKTYDR